MEAAADRELHVFRFGGGDALADRILALRTARGVAARSSASDATASLFTDAPQASTRSIAQNAMRLCAAQRTGPDCLLCVQN